MTEKKPTVAAAMKSPCSHCPWRLSNRGKKIKTKGMPYGWYTKKNLQRLWAGLRTGEAPGMTCHPTDPDNEVPEHWKEVPKETQTKECAGALLLIIREIKLLEKDVDGYLKSKRRGLTKAGLTWWAMGRCGPAAGTPLGGPSISLIEEDPDIQYEPLVLDEASAPK
jgi:hypothetical protein